MRLTRESTTEKIIFVCMGNTCRSPMAENIFNLLCLQGKLDYRATSAGVSAFPGIGMQPHARAALETLSVPIDDGFSSKPLTQKVIEKCELIVCMNSYIAGLVSDLFDICAHEKIKVLGEGISDPYGENKDCYLSVARSIYSACKELIEEIKIKK